MLNKKTKILYISHSPFFNGAEICLLTLLRNIDRDHFEPVVVFPYEGPLVGEVNSLGIKTYISPLERWIRYKFEKPIANINLKKRISSISEIIENESIDIVHTNSSVIAEGAVAAKYKNIPHVWHIHEYLKENPELNPCLPVTLIYNIISYLSDQIVSVSDFVKSQFESGVNDPNITTIYNGVEKNHIQIDNISMRGEFGIKCDEIMAVTIGLLTEAKGFINLLDAAFLAIEKGIKIKFFWFGGSDAKTIRNFKKRARKLGLEDTVFYSGFRKDIPDLLRCSDILICPSMMETLSLAILEAMAAGKPVITTDCGGPSECVVENLTGYIVPVNNQVKLSQAIADLSADKSERDRLGANGLERFISKFTSEIFVNNIQEMYRSLVEFRKSEQFSFKDNIVIDSLIDIYQDISDRHWKTIGSRK